MNVATRVQDALRQPIEVGGLNIHVNGSIGIALYPHDSADASQLLQHADVAMYTAKRTQLGISQYHSHLDEHSTRQLTLLGELRRAIEGNELVLHYQPKAYTSTGQVCGVEALVRWQHPEHGLLGPMEFIPLAEENGLIEALTHTVLDAALAQCRRWHDDGLDLPVAVNIAARSLLDAAFTDDVDRLLIMHRLPPQMLTLELTESAIIADPTRALDVMSRLRQLGVRLSIDDFGTGYSSMAHLRTLPVSELKIDRSFVMHMRTHLSDEAIVRALLGLAQSLDLEVVAEGVEDNETWSALRELGCTITQGYFLSRPLPADALVEWMDRQRVGTAAGEVA
jgi:EAL domain-containing protein (putative c-di-GMP-specific phosphodiesterase class I)